MGLLTSAAYAVVVTNTPSPICDLIPQNSQGVNGIRCQYRDLGTSSYTDLAYLSDYYWGTPGVSWNVPYVQLLSPGKCRVHPAAVTQTGHNRDGVIRVRIEGSATSILIAGETGTDSSTSVTFYVYKGAGNWASPIWSGGPGEAFSVTSSCRDGDELFFATNAQGSDVNDKAFYRNVTITGQAFVPTIIEAPRSVTNFSGTTATFTVNASGTAPLAYQWRKDVLPLADGGNVSGARSNVLTLANVQSADTGQYCVVVTNTAGSVTSRLASLALAVPPQILTQPQSQAVLAGASMFLSVTVTGMPPISFQWRFKGTNLAEGNRISGTRTSNLTITNVQSQDAGSYTAVVRNPWASVTSAPARLFYGERLTLSVSNQTSARFDFTNVDWVEIVLTNAGFPNPLTFYTLDGSPPSPASGFYSDPLILSNTVVVRAIAYNPVDFSSVTNAPAAVNLWTAFHLFATATAGGMVSNAPPGGFYLSNTVVTLTAVPEVGWEFLSWTGDASGSSNPLSLVMDRDKSVSAAFGPSPLFTLTVMKVGGGAVSGNIQSNYFRGTTVNLSAEPAPGWTFLNWMGDASGTNPQASVTMDRSKEVQAVFGTECKTNVLGQGVVVRNFGVGLVPFGTVVRLTAIPQTNYYFGLWGGAASSVVNPLDFTVTNASPTVGAFFLPLSANQATLTVLEQGAGVAVCQPQLNAYTKGQVVQLMAQPFPGQDFLGWAGDPSGTQNPLTVTVTTNQTITATFTHRLGLAIQPWPGPTQRRGFRFLLTGDEGNTCLVQTSPDLADWQPLTTLTISNTAVQFIDLAVTNHSPRFYRGVLR